MAFDPTKPVENSPLDAAEMRNQFNALKALIDAQQAQINALQPALPTPVLDRDDDTDADRLTLSKTLQPVQPDQWLGWKSDTGNGNPDTNPDEWNGPLGYDKDLSDNANWVIEWNGFEDNNYFIAAYRVGSIRSPYSNVVSPS